MHIIYIVYDELKNEILYLTICDILIPCSLSYPFSIASVLPQTPYRPISTLTPPPFPFLFLPSAINCIQDYYHLILSLLYILYMHGGYLFMFCYFYLLFYFVKRLSVFF
jgi:hypothetical protein